MTQDASNTARTIRPYLASHDGSDLEVDREAVSRERKLYPEWIDLGGEGGVE